MNRSLFDRFRLDWGYPHAPANAVILDKIKYDPATRPNPSARQHAFFSWIKEKTKGRMEDVGARFKDLYYSKLQISSFNDDQWLYTRALGLGGFGAVALYKHYDLNGNVNDQIVLKTTKIRADLAACPEAREYDLSEEAAIMAQTNASPQDGLVVLRHFQAHMEEFHRPEGEWRYYLELCEHGDLARLKSRYKAYGRYFPELFLWHIFYWMATGLERYVHGVETVDDQPVWRSYDYDTWGEIIKAGFLLHMDLKPQNILLGEPDENDPLGNYCIPRLADLGLAEISQPFDPANKAYKMKKGTRRYYVPELRADELQLFSDFYPFEDTMAEIASAHDGPVKQSHSIKSTANVFAVGMIMWEMLTLNEIHELQSKVSKLLSEENPLDRSDGRFVSVVDVSDFFTLKDSVAPYSDDLVDAIRACLFLNPRDRIDETSLRQYTYDKYMQALRKVREEAQRFPRGNRRPQTDKECAEDNQPTYYRRNEIENAHAAAPPSDLVYNIPGRTNSWWQSAFIDQYCWLDEDWTPLHPPDMPRGTRPPAYWPEGLQRLMSGDPKNPLGYNDDDDFEDLYVKFFASGGTDEAEVNRLESFDRGRQGYGQLDRPQAGGSQDYYSQHQDEDAFIGQNPRVANPYQTLNPGFPVDSDIIRRQRRQERFGGVPLDSEEVRRRLRAQRFGQNPPQDLNDPNHFQPMNLGPQQQGPYQPSPHGFPGPNPYQNQGQNPYANPNLYVNPGDNQNGPGGAFLAGYDARQGQGQGQGGGARPNEDGFIDVNLGDVSMHDVESGEIRPTQPHGGGVGTPRGGLRSGWNSPRWGPYTRQRGGRRRMEG